MGDILRLRSGYGGETFPRPSTHFSIDKSYLFYVEEDKAYYFYSP